jgi:NAD(P)-dependent dehydrogenase (short-subunit alcohol dehydrogenase family)
MPRALIVGASRGLGLGLVEGLADRGWGVLATVRDPAAAADLNQLALRGKARIERLDVTEPETAQALRDNLADEPPFDLLFLVAGIGHPRGKTVLTAADAEAMNQFRTNAVGPVRTAEILLDVVAPQGGTVAFMSSQLGSVARRDAAYADLYSASKAALNSLSRSFAARHADRGLTVLSLHPGWVRTDLGGDEAPLDVDTSVRGLIEVVERHRAQGGDLFLDYRDQTLPW